MLNTIRMALKSIRIAHAKNVLMARDEVLESMSGYPTIQYRMVGNDMRRKPLTEGYYSPKDIPWSLGMQVGKNMYIFNGCVDPEDLKIIERRITKAKFMRVFSGRFTSVKFITHTESDDRTGESVTTTNPHFA